MCRKELVEEYTIRNGESIECSHFEGYVNLKTVNIQNDFTIDIDRYTRFGPFTPSLERFCVLDERSPFFTDGGVLYLNIDKARKQEKEQNTTNYFLENCNLPDSLSGNMLVAIPPRYRDTTFVVPDYVVAIGCGAFCGSHIEKLVISGSVKIIGMAGLLEMDNLKELRVPNHPIYIFWDHNYIGHKIDVSCSEKDVELSAEIKSFWYNLLVEDKYDEKLVNPVAAELKMFEKKGMDWYEMCLIDNVRTYTMRQWRLGQLHGVDHWDRVYENGQKLLTPEVNPLVVALFAYLHDSCRVEDGEDINHGARAAELIDTIRETYLKIVSDDDVELLKKACRLHTTKHKTGNLTIDACFDADRLDLWRVGIMPDPERMATEKGKEIARNTVYDYEPLVMPWMGDELEDNCG